VQTLIRLADGEKLLAHLQNRQQKG
jgi:hypothetical protein